SRMTVCVYLAETGSGSELFCHHHANPLGLNTALFYLFRLGKLRSDLMVILVILSPWFSALSYVVAASP
ncbi:hypothetical protein, partial [Vibrio lentus]|uniref:hypothetical protein n=1 Tax=Vibrio lentus TaxID=136468 RepID=UPI001A7E0D45